MALAARNAIEFLSTRAKLTPLDAYGVCSIAVSFRVTQVVDIVRGVHAMIPKSLFTRELRGQIARSNLNGTAARRLCHSLRKYRAPYIRDGRPAPRGFSWGKQCRRNEQMATHPKLSGRTRYYKAARVLSRAGIITPQRLAKEAGISVSSARDSIVAFKGITRALYEKAHPGAFRVRLGP
jgi:hypothetical protein